METVGKLLFYIIIATIVVYGFVYLAEIEFFYSSISDFFGG